MVSSTSNKTKSKHTTVEISQKAVEYRKVGLSYREIGEKLGVGLKAARQMVSEEVGKLEEMSKDEPLVARRMQLERINRMRLGLMSKAAKGDPQAISTILKCDEHENKLLRVHENEDPQKEYVFSWLGEDA